MTNKRDAVIELVTDVTGVRPATSSRLVKLLISALPHIGAHSLHAAGDLRVLLSPGGWKPGLSQELEPAEADCTEALRPIVEVAAALRAPEDPTATGRRRRDPVRTAARELLGDSGRDTASISAATYQMNENRGFTAQARALAKYLRVVERTVQVAMKPEKGADADWVDFDAAVHVGQLVDLITPLAAERIAEAGAESLDETTALSELLDSHPWTSSDGEHRALATRLAKGWEAHFGARQLDALAQLTSLDSLDDWTLPGAEEWLCTGAKAVREFLDGPPGHEAQGTRTSMAVVHAWNRAAWRYGEIPVGDDDRPLPQRTGIGAVASSGRRPARPNSGTSDSPEVTDHPNEFRGNELRLATRRVEDVAGADPMFEQLAQSAVQRARGRMLRKAQREYLTRREHELDPNLPRPFRIADPEDESGWIGQAKRAVNHGLSDAWETFWPQYLGAKEEAPWDVGVSAWRLLLAAAQRLAAQNPDCGATLGDWFDDLIEDDLELACRVVCQGRPPSPRDWPGIVNALQETLAAQGPGAGAEWDESMARTATQVFATAATLATGLGLVAGTVEGVS